MGHRLRLLHSTKGHLHLPFIPAAPAIGRHIQPIHEVVAIGDDIMFSNRHAGRFRADGDSLSDRDGPRATIDLLPQERIGDVQVLDDLDATLRPYLAR